MKWLLIILSLSIFFACDKNSDNSTNTKYGLIPKSLQNHKWIKDSLHHITPDWTVTGLIDPPGSEYEVFTDTFWIHKQSVTPSEQIYHASFGAPDKIYYWGYGYPQSDTVFLKIESVNDSNLVIREDYDADIHTTIIRYYHAE